MISWANRNICCQRVWNCCIFEKYKQLHSAVVESERIWGPAIGYLKQFISRYHLYFQLRPSSTLLSRNLAWVCAIDYTEQTLLGHSARLLPFSRRNGCMRHMRERTCAPKQDWCAHACEYMRTHAAVWAKIDRRMRKALRDGVASARILARRSLKCR